MGGVAKPATWIIFFDWINCLFRHHVDTVKHSSRFPCVWMVLKLSREAVLPGSFAKKIWKSKQPLSHWPYNQVSKSFFFFSFLFHTRENMFLLQEKSHQNLDGSLNWDQDSGLQSWFCFGWVISRPSCGPQFPHLFLQALWLKNHILGAQSLSLLASSNLCFLATAHSRSQVPEICLSLWNFACWAYSPQQPIYTDRPQMSVLMTDLSSHCFWIFLVTSQS